MNAIFIVFLFPVFIGIFSVAAVPAFGGTLLAIGFILAAILFLVRSRAVRGFRSQWISERGTSSVDQTDAIPSTTPSTSPSDAEILEITRSLAQQFDLQ
jgi:hypothetical protein